MVYIYKVKYSYGKNFWSTITFISPYQMNRTEIKSYLQNQNSILCHDTITFLSFEEKPIDINTFEQPIILYTGE